MKKTWMRVVIALAVGASLGLSGAALAKKGGNSGKGTPPGQAKKQEVTVQVGSAGTTTSTPPGWSHGKKTGWQGMPYPPGWSNWDKKKQDTWVNDRDGALDEIHRIALSYKIPTQNVDQITQAFGQAVAGGLVVHDASKKLVNALQDEGERKKLLINTSQNVLELLK